MIISKIISIIILGLTLFEKSHCQYPLKNLKLNVSKHNCVIKFDFKNLAKKKIEIPNYVVMATDTIEHMLVMPNDILKNKGDTLILFTRHAKYLEGNYDTLKNNGLYVSDYGKRDSKSRIVITSNAISLKRRSIQILRMPLQYCSQKYKYCKIYFNNNLLAVARVK